QHLDDDLSHWVERDGREHHQAEIAEALSVSGEIARHGVAGHDPYRDDQSGAAERRSDVIRFDRFGVVIRSERAEDVREDYERDDAGGQENYRRDNRAAVTAERPGHDLARSEKDGAVNDPRREIARGDLFAQRRSHPAAVLLEDHAGHGHRDDASYAVRRDAFDVGPERVARPRPHRNDHLKHAQQEPA